MAKNKEFTYEEYVESEAVRRAEEALSNHLASAPGAYQSRWDGQITGTLDSILNRKKFNYDFNADPIYQQYRDRYLKQGRLAMQDTVGQAASLTGGYGNSWAATAGNQAYQSYLEGLNDMLPEFYAMAADRYDREGDQLLSQYSVLSNQEAVDYGKYRDSVSDYQVDRDYLAGRYDSERDYDYGVYSDDRNFSYNVFNDQRNYEFQQQRASAQDAQWAAEMAFKAEQARIAAEQWAAELAFQQARASAEDSQWQQQFDYKISLDGSSDTSASPSSSPDSGASQGDSGGGVSLSPQLMSAFKSYVNAGDIDAAMDMLKTFKAGGVSAEELEECMRLISEFYDRGNGGSPAMSLTGVGGISSGRPAHVTVGNR